MHNLTHRYSGVIFNQNQVPFTASDFLIPNGAWVIQDFFLPTDYRRGMVSSELRYPDLSGVQVMVGIADNMQEDGQIDYKLEYQVFGLGWIELASGTATGADIAGDKVWMGVYFDEPIEIDDTKSTARFRVQLRPSLTSGVTKLWFSRPNPLSTRGNKAYAANGTTPLTQSGEEYSFNFRVLGLIAEEGVDFLGNVYRSAVVRNRPDLITTAEGNDPDTYWLSKPNPSKFAIECLYFDMTDASTDHTVIDKVLVDPITPGVYFNLYYSNEGEGGTSEGDWDEKMWTHVPKTFRAERRETHILPEPISAKFLKIEFSHLQARYYAPGNFAQGIRYKKHPKWVLDYFLARTSTQAQFSNPFLVDQVVVIFDALDLAYNYYLDDLRQEPLQPVEVDPAYTTKLTDFLLDRTDASDQVDLTTLQKINRVMAPYRTHPALRGQLESILGVSARVSALSEEDYSVESMPPAATNSPDVSVLNRESVAFEQNYPVMFFYLTCRHGYRIIEANFTHDRAYFAGIRQIAFLRDNYMTAHDNQTYIEPNADTLNIERNDFQTSPGGILTVE